MKLLLVAFCLMLQGVLFSQYKFMEEMKESSIHIGSGNYLYHVENESAV